MSGSTQDGVSGQFFIIKLDKKILCSDEMHSAVEASLAKGKQSDWKTVEDVMRQTDGHEKATVVQATRLYYNSENASM